MTSEDGEEGVFQNLEVGFGGVMVFCRERVMESPLQFGKLHT